LLPHYFPEEEAVFPEVVEPPELGTVCKSLPLVLLPGVVEPFLDVVEFGTVFRSLPLVLLPGVCILPPDDDDIPPEDIPPEDIPPEEEV
jgi:hypothetical protein